MYRFYRTDAMATLILGNDKNKYLVNPYMLNKPLRKVKVKICSHQISLRSQNVCLSCDKLCNACFLLIKKSLTFSNHMHFKISCECSSKWPKQ